VLEMSAATRGYGEVVRFVGAGEGILLRSGQACPCTKPTLPGIVNGIGDDLFSVGGDGYGKLDGLGIGLMRVG